MQLYNVFGFPIVRDQLIANTVLVAIATLLVILRGVSRRLRKTGAGWDDAFCVAGLFHTYGMLAMQYHYARVGMRYHITEIPSENAVVIAKMLMVYQIVYYNAMVLAKFSYLAFYLRIFVSREFRILTWTCIGFSAAYWVGSMLQVFLICTPFARNWNPTLPGHCANQNVAFSTIGAFNLITDMIIVALPVRFVWNLNMSVATKMGLVGIFGLGAFISSITIIRIRVLTTVDFTDLSYSMIWAAFWSVTEPALAIGNACAPMLRPILKAAFPSLFGSHDGYSSQPFTGGPTSLSKNSTVKRGHGMDEEDSEFPLTRLDQIPGSADGLSLNDQSQDGRSHYASYQVSTTIVGPAKGL
ncbi:hypothetical protein DTO013E5_9935 [Penicillium roqueforti]|uniref:Rhodopsin domain-containing protein n=1 Tax=Penicillium roqueforti (strain FM164) TaxID=1365484 RepID=W6R376_PENRF|nr:uncharacterized protein LCP9604111_9651 [Penicillium roqueforti]CDM36242.1 unnamed protein product [Penicillium roqueforti FM164]KAF9237803.1 hypothetical protein LCP9604111_9651 [Penicillium roqueforti]KAI1829315.1 hypothetical protein CBS147337_9874 [Penicillium roqueforti]KAI2676107.1 hypothetical protein CBS147355_6288 [Penicillium roqueforti]KAI2684179.1 hypothetical protein LCP963914a_5479 [Penicillium roqueforti]